MEIPKKIDRETKIGQKLEWIKVSILWTLCFARRYSVYLFVVLFNIGWVLVTIVIVYDLPKSPIPLVNAAVSSMFRADPAVSSEPPECSIISPIANDAHNQVKRVGDLPAGLIRLYLGSGVADGYYFDIGRRISQALSEQKPGKTACAEGKERKIHVTDLSSRGSIDNIYCALKGDVHLFLSQTDIVQTFPHLDIGKCQINSEPLKRIYTEAVTIIARRDMHAENIEDLKGLEVCLPMKGSGSYDNAHKILDAFDIVIKDESSGGMHYSDCMLAIEDGRFDAMIYTIKHPHGPLLRFSQETSRPIRFLSIRRLDVSNNINKDKLIKAKLTPCEDAIDISQYPQIARWMEPDDLNQKTAVVSTYCTQAALFHTDCIDENILKVLKYRLQEAGYSYLVPPHLYEPRFAERTVAERCEQLR